MQSMYINSKVTHKISYKKKIPHEETVTIFMRNKQSLESYALYGYRLTSNPLRRNASSVL